MEKIDRTGIYLIGEHSNWSESGQKAALHENVYADKAAWQQFLRLLFLSLGVGLMTAGVLFFFAYNWADLSKFTKFGLVEALVLSVGIVTLFSKFNPLIKQILLTAMAVLVGVLFAVFGQVYQTGADSYSFFLAWTVFIAIWVAVSNFPPLWAIFIVLLNTTCHLYFWQTTSFSSSKTIEFNTLMFGLNSLIFMFFVGIGFIQKFKEKSLVPNWFLNLLGLYIAGLGAANTLFTIFEYNSFKTPFFINFFVVIIVYIGGLFYAFTRKNIFLLAAIPFSSIAITAGLLVKIFYEWTDNSTKNEVSIAFFISIFVIVSVTLLVKYLLDFSKKQQAIS